ncbi:MAG: prolipoprotein diacylglyceryl transferase, partial [Mycobacterium sp.]
MTTTVLAYIPSPSQGVWHLWIFPVRAYALCIIAGIVAALIIGDRRWAARGGERGVVYDIALWAVPFGLIGGRLYHVITDWPKYFGPDGAGFVAALRIWDGGLGIWGAVALGGVGAWIACRRMGVPLPAFGDAVAPGIILAQAIGRLGNYFNQELYGRETDLPWGLTIYNRLDPSGVVSPHSLDGVSTGQVYTVVHPTFLYELLWNLLVFAVLIWADRRFNLGHGRLFALYVAGYCVGRFWVELMRSDDATLIAGIRVNSFTSMFVLIGAVIYIMVAPKGREDPATLQGKDSEVPDEARREEVIDDLKAVEATSGVLAAVQLAGADDDGGSSGDHDPVESGHVRSEAAAEAEDLVEQVETAPSEDIAEAEEFAEVGAAAEERPAAIGALVGQEAVEAEASSPEEPAPEQSAENEIGLGSVEGDEVAAVEDSAAEVHAATEQGAVDAEVAAEDVAAEDVAAEPESAEPETAEPESAEEAPAEEPDVEESASRESAENEIGVGSVEGDEVAAAEDSAAEVHAATEQGAADAEAAAEDVAAEPESAEDVAAEPESAESESAEEAAAEEAPAEEPDVEESASRESAENEIGLGSVEGDEVAAAEDSAAEVHAATEQGDGDAEEAAEELAD